MSATAEPMLQTELWVSFVAVLRSYAAAASLHAGNDSDKVWIRVTKGQVTISAFAAQIEMSFDGESGSGVWEKRVAGRLSFPGTFVIEPEGRIRIDGAIKDFDHAAIDLIASVTEGAKGGQR